MSSPQPPANIIAAVAGQAQIYGVPQDIWEDIAYAESSYKVDARNGSAYGLFQLLTPGGQGDAAIQAGHSIQDLYNPAINAQYAMPSIGAAWRTMQPSFDPNSDLWWQWFAAKSGHPGGNPGNPETNQEAANLKKWYLDNQNKPTVTDPTQVATQNGITLSDPCSNGNVLGCVQKTIGDLQNNITGVQNAAPHALISIGLFVLSVGLLIAGFFILVKAA